MSDPFFSLPGNPTDIDQDEFYRLVAIGGDIKSRIYRPDFLRSQTPPLRRRVRDCRFVEVSFSKTLIEDIEFRKCTFTSCRFIGSIFKNCRFSECTFIDSNTYRIEFIDVYISPRSFDRCLDKTRHQNIGVHLYQELLNNSRRQSQPDFAQQSLFEFRRWLRFQQIYDLRNDVALGRTARLLQIKNALSIAASRVVQSLFGFGVRLRNYAVTAGLLTTALSAVNYHYASQFGLVAVCKGGFADALYFTVITLTTIGYGDITPTTSIGRIVIAGEGIVGFVLFATLASMIYRKILP